MPLLIKLVLLTAAASGVTALKKNHLRGEESLQQLRSYTFDDFVSKFGRAYIPGSAEWIKRALIFDHRLKEVIKFQSGPPQSWSMGVTKFADFTEAEFKAVLGYKGSRSRKASGEYTKFSKVPTANLPLSHTTIGTSDFHTIRKVVRDQGSCGSCWAEAATSVLEGHMEANQTLMKKINSALAIHYGKATIGTLSSQTMVSCTANPRNCGGTGGCDGATVELAYEMVKDNGIPFAAEWGYESGFGGTPQCKTDIFKRAQVGIDGYVALPSNKWNPLMQALYDTGAPVAVSVDASSWSMYIGGIYSDSSFGKGEFTVNHAVTLVAFQRPGGPTGKGYWMIKNSWGPYWGEDGFIRLEMKENEEEHCGWDHSAHDGVACDGDPDEAWVCGTCGVLYDSVYPKGLHFKLREE